MHRLQKARLVPTARSTASGPGQVLLPKVLPCMESPWKARACVCPPFVPPCQASLPARSRVRCWKGGQTPPPLKQSGLLLSQAALRDGQWHFLFLHLLCKRVPSQGDEHISTFTSLKALRVLGTAQGPGWLPASAGTPALLSSTQDGAGKVLLSLVSPRACYEQHNCTTQESGDFSGPRLAWAQAEPAKQCTRSPRSSK